MIAYKVLLRDKQGKRWSAGSLPSWMRQQYYVTKVNRPKLPNSKLLVFDNLQAALSFRREVAFVNKHREVWTVLADKGQSVAFLPPAWTGRRSEKDFRPFVTSFWKQKGAPKSKSGLAGACSNVVAVSSIRLLEQVC